MSRPDYCFLKPLGARVRAVRAWRFKMSGLSGHSTLGVSGLSGQSEHATLAAMVDEITAARAAILVGRNERTLRRHIAVGSLIARKTHNGWSIARADLAERYGLVQQPAARPVLVQQKPPPRLVQQPEPVRSYTSLVQHTEPPRITQGHFKTHADAARWLVAHGLNSELTPKTWPGWRSTPLTARAILGLALSFLVIKNHRITWRLRPCGDDKCVCVEMLP